MYAKNKIKTGLALIGTVIAIFGCVSEEDFETPELVIQEPEVNGTMIMIDAALGILGQEIEKDGEKAKVVFDDTGNFITGYVISSDKASNFFKELILQDKDKHPQAGIRVLIDNSPLFTKYEFGRKVYVKLDGLSLGMQNGVATLGISEGNAIGAIPSFSLDEVVIRSTEISEILPRLVTVEDFTDKLLNLFIKVDNIQFNKNMVQDNNVFTFAAEANDQFDGERLVESCNTGRSVVLSTSTFSDFRGLKLPAQQGSFEGILTKNFEGDTYNLVLNDPTGLIFDNETRCDPIILDCPPANQGSSLMFEENFTDLKIKDLEDKGWINTNTTGGKLNYKIGDFAGNQYVQITGFRSKESVYEVWLITPELDIGISTNAVLNFDLQAGYDNGNILEVFITNSFTGDPKDTNWIKLGATIPRAPLNAFGDFISSGPIGLSCLEGGVRIGFRYIGGDPRATTRYHIDNIKVTCN
ncbi:DUF5689 domain-containing protein [Aquimarina mytili]|uniref:Choice-of-anchor J domain-containing protein n=1 Tax=Aquimarina mytili TaxID=874423 RepID=A0A937DCA6_9FLAO|nr:DUF5689 domain-containing protein [Aquimarina mytili]MBL0684731.1 choice-of-anchor J domain-containing protein [Aquimarina mytili]